MRLAFIFVVVSLAMSQALCLWADEGLPTFLKWDYLRFPRERNGNMRLELKLSSSTGEPISDAAWSYRLIVLQGFRGKGARAPEPVVYGGTFPEGNYELDIVSGTTVLADVRGTAMVGGRRMYAQASTMIFGDQLGAYKLPPSDAAEPAWPDYLMASSGYLYWPQTGETFSLQPMGPGAPMSYTVYDAKGPSSGSYLPEEGGGNGFVPDHDPTLNAGRSADAKPLYFVGQTKDGSVYAYTLNVHRSRYANMHEALGFLLFFGSLGLTGLILAVRYLKRRSLSYAVRPY
ncbi:MAG: hypothetical protein LBF40_00745 [Deltaproteobacteria bacterium]|nr:hypothetical protein [Deltaproteobacteria bacterium]